MSLYEDLQEAVEVVAPRLSEKPLAALTLGSGLGFIADDLEDAVAIPYAEIPHFPVSTVPGHAGSLVSGRMNGRPLLLMQGRVHLYEGYSPEQVTFATRTAVLLGAETVILTNAAGGLSPSWKAGDFMVIKDQINLQGVNVLTGPEEPRLGQRFLDLTNLYDPALSHSLLAWARESKTVLRHGVYAGLTGPTYETQAEVHMLRTLGADAVGMSTVQVAIAARQQGARVAGLSAITNLAAGVSAEPLSHEDVQNTARESRQDFAALLKKLVELL